MHHHQRGPCCHPCPYPVHQAPCHCHSPGTVMAQALGLCLPFLSMLAPRDRWELSTMAGTRYS